MPQERRENFFTELLKFLVLAAIIVLPVRLFVAQPFIVSGASMEDTFKNGEYLIVDELSYRLSEPTRGDVVIFRYPRNPSEFFIKRVIGLPNEVVYLNGDEVSVKQQDGTLLQLNEPYAVQSGSRAQVSFALGDKEYFVLGDNRGESSDSRVWGTLPRENIVGRAFVRLFPLQTISFLPGSAHY